MKTIDIFYKSYHKDFNLLLLSLKTLKRNVSGYNNVIILIPEHEKELFDTRDLPNRTLIHYIPEYGNGYLFQQWCKLSAHKHSYADYVLFADSDMFFDHPINVQDFIKNDKPEILYTSWDKVGDAICWKEPTEKIIGEAVAWEHMRRLPLVYHRETLFAINEMYPNLENTVMNSERFSEFNFIGAWCRKYMGDRYMFTNTDHWAYVPPAATQVWSHASKEPGADELHLREYIRTLETLLKAFEIKL